MSAAAPQETLHRFLVQGPVGELICLSRNHRIVGLAFPGQLQILNRLSHNAVVLNQTVEELRCVLQEHLNQKIEYQHHFSALPLELHGSALQKKVWFELTQIPWGETRSYSDIAAKIGEGVHPRAVANAIAANPILILIPCHRVISKSGKLSGYSGGIENKRKLLEWERENLPQKRS
ncbi:MAG: hypothetical protein RI932_669 [Pseudomonadota bacterium]|jgi:O-6-methylguanine DNA methyltransferase